jgi:hypothetical protein
MSRPPAAIVAAALSAAPRLRPTVFVASDSRNEVALGRRALICARQAFAEHHTIADAGDDRDPGRTGLGVACHCPAEVFDFAVDVEV